MNLLTKTYTLALLLLCLSQNIQAENIAIMESKSFHPLQIMDDNWMAVAESMGHQATIYNQNTLDNIENLENADVLIISSGLIDLPANRQATIQAFLESGRSVYIQSEFLLYHPGNITFQNMVNNLGDDFTWEGEDSGSIAPMEIEGEFANTPNTINELSYYWYGTYGSGDASIIPFLKNNNKNYGFLYCPSNMNTGKIVTTTDQDWIRINLSTDLMENILFTLVNTNTMTATPLVSIEMTQEANCQGDPFTFTANIQNNVSGLNIQWTVNGIVVNGENETTYSTINLNDGDVVECVISFAADCFDYEHVSNPILIAPIFPLGTPTIQVITDQTDICQEQEVLFTAVLGDTASVMDFTLQWYLNGTMISGANGETLLINDLENNDQISCELIYDNYCDTDLSIPANIITLSVVPGLLPNVSITATILEICEGELVTFSASGIYWGINPNIQWQIDGVNVGTNDPVFETTELTNGQQISCILTSSANCLLANDIESNQINITVNETLTPSIQVNADVNQICQGELVNFTAQGENWGSTPFFQWMADGQLVGDNSPSFSSSSLNPNSQITCIVTADGGCLSFSVVEAEPMSVLVTIPQMPSISIQADYNQICEGSEVTFTATGTDFGDNPIFQWLVDGVNVGNNIPSFSTTDLTSNQVVTCVLISNAECISNNEVSSNNLSVVVAPISISLLESTNNFCDQLTGAATVNVIGGVAPFNYEWDNGVNGANIENLDGGIYTVTATDAIGCSAMIEVIIENSVGLAVEKIEIENVDCGGSDGQARVIMTDITKEYFYTWTNQQGEIVSLEPFAFNLALGTYEVEISDENDCSSIETVVIEASVPVILELEESIRIEIGESYTLSPKVSSAGNLTYEWSSTEGLSCTDCLNPTVTLFQEAKYTLTVTNEAGCSATASVIIYLDLNHDIYIPNAFSPNGDGQNDYFTAYAGDNVSHIKTLQIVDRWGNVLFSKSDLAPNHEAAGWNGTFKGKPLATGVFIYMMEVVFTDGAQEIISGDISIIH